MGAFYPGLVPSYPDRHDLSWVHLSGGIDDVGRYATFCPPAGTGAVGVLVAKIGVEIPLEGGVGRVQAAGEAGSPALIEDRLVQILNMSVGRRAPGADAGGARTERLDDLAEPETREPRSVI